MKNVDVIVNVYGKPWQTLCSLKSLMLHSGEHIDKIYFIEEREQPNNENVRWVVGEFDNIIHYIPNKYFFTPKTYSFGDLNVAENRYNFRYQYGIENSDKKYVFIMHNDVLFTGDIIGDMLDEINDNVGIGLIGQCWNCPAHYQFLCDREKYWEYNPTYDEVIDICKIKEPARGGMFINYLNKIKPMPLPECRLNEFSCLINIEITNKETVPMSSTPFFGSYDMLDLGDAWFRNLNLKGYKFKNYNINNKSIHGYYTSIINKYNTTGYSVQRDSVLYIESEEFAKKYYNENLK